MKKLPRNHAFLFLFPVALDNFKATNDKIQNAIWFKTIRKSLMQKKRN